MDECVSESSWASRTDSASSSSSSLESFTVSKHRSVRFADELPGGSLTECRLIEAIVHDDDVTIFLAELAGGIEVSLFFPKRLFGKRKRALVFTDDGGVSLCFVQEGGRCARRVPVSSILSVKDVSRDGGGDCAALRPVRLQLTYAASGAPGADTSSCASKAVLMDTPPPAARAFARCLPRLYDFRPAGIC